MTVQYDINEIGPGLDAQALLKLKTWFAGYCGRFAGCDDAVTANLAMKKEHTEKVCMEIGEIARSLGLNEPECRLADAVALLHDVGRFEQYERYGTFADSKSENHATLSARILNREGALADLAWDTRKLIIDVVSFHNCAELPAGRDERCIFYLKLLRDADKLDIWRVVTEYYQRSERTRNTSLELDLPDQPRVSLAIVEDLLAGRIARTGDMETLNDFKLLQMGWVFDLGFCRSFRIARDRRYLEKIRNVLPDIEQVRQIYEKARVYMYARCADMTDAAPQGNPVPVRDPALLESESSR
ncbi:MAG: HD domain-containing protein [Chitinivibrionales bacterium]|nr:HD domain-containing protein [Chitinivibrionales bacterium]MBD3394437.1 HD domain-containing protein [Chitinivibrionales bacterium]